MNVPSYFTMKKRSQEKEKVKESMESIPDVVYFALEIPVQFLSIKTKNQLKGKAAIPFGYVVLGEKTSIGRMGSDFDLDNGNLSPIHFTIWVQDGVAIIKDNGGRLGLSVNGLKPIAGLKIILEENDQINIGEMSFRLVKRNTKNTHWDHCTFWPNNIEAKANAKLVDHTQVLPPIPQEEMTRIDTQQNTNPQVPDYSQTIIDPMPVSIPIQSATLNDKISANPIMRLCSIGIDLALSCLIGMNLMGLKFVTHLENGFHKSIIPTLTPIFSSLVGENAWKSSETLIVMLLLGYVLFGLGRIVSAAFLGVSLGEFCMGLKGDTGFVWNRLGGPIRNFIGLFTFPFFLILDMPCVVGRRTFKEWITSTKVVWNGFTQMLIGLFILLPICIFANFLWPVFIPQYKTPSIIVTKRFFNPSMDDNLKNENITPSLSYLYKFKYYQNDKLDLYPNVQVEQIKTNVVVRPKMDFYPTNDATYMIKPTQLSIVGKSKLYSWIDKLIDRSLFFSSFYPNLHYFIKYSRHTQKEHQLYPEVQAEMIKLMTQTLSLDVQNVFPFIMSNGPFLPGFLSFKNKLFSLVPHAMVNKINADIVEIAKKPFLMMYPQRSDAFVPLDEKKYIFVPLNGSNSSVLEVTQDPNVEIGTFLKVLGGSIEWVTMDGQTDPYLPSVDNLNAFSILDGIVNKKLPQATKNILEDGLYDYFYRQCQFQLFSTHAQMDPSASKAILERIQGYVSKWAMAYSKSSGSYHTILFVKRLEELAAGIELAREKDIVSFFEDEKEQF